VSRVRRSASRYMSSKVSNNLDEVPPNSYLSGAIDGRHGQDGAYVAAKIDAELVCAADRVPSLLANSWEALKYRTDKNYMHYIPSIKEYKGKNIEVFVLGYDEANLDFNAELWISAYSHPRKKVKLVLGK